MLWAQCFKCISQLDQHVGIWGLLLAIWRRARWRDVRDKDGSVVDLLEDRVCDRSQARNVLSVMVKLGTLGLRPLQLIGQLREGRHQRGLDEVAPFCCWCVGLPRPEDLHDVAAGKSAILPSLVSSGPKTSHSTGVMPGHLDARTARGTVISLSGAQ
ncbi:hypothetical protein FQZ97_1037130 [compost metagenome]